MLRKGINTLCVTCGLLGFLAPALASDSDSPGPAKSAKVRAVLTGYASVPAISSTGTGRFLAQIDAFNNVISYQLSYSGLEGEVQQTHIHLGQASANGGVGAFLCSNLPNPPAGTPACPASGVVTGIIQANGVVGPSVQGIAPGEFAELVAAIRAGFTYINIHTSLFPPGEIRGQIKSVDD